MHEYALAESVVDAAVETARRESIVKIETVVVRVGELQRIKPDIFEFALNEIVRRAVPDLAETRFEVTVEPARMRCHACGTDFALSDAIGSVGEDEAEAIHFVPELSHAFMRCPACHSPDFEIVSGRGVTLASLEGETED